MHAGSIPERHFSPWPNTFIYALHCTHRPALAVHADAARASQAALFAAMLEVPWTDEEGIPDIMDPDGEYARLVAMPRGSAMQRCMGGVEPIDDGEWIAAAEGGCQVGFVWMMSTTALCFVADVMGGMHFPPCHASTGPSFTPSPLKYQRAHVKATPFWPQATSLVLPPTVIARDLGRTFPEHPLFVGGDGQVKLGRLLRAYALHDEEIGYCQGQGACWGFAEIQVYAEWCGVQSWLGSRAVLLGKRCDNPLMPDV